MSSHAKIGWRRMFSSFFCECIEKKRQNIALIIKMYYIVLGRSIFGRHDTRILLGYDTVNVAHILGIFCILPCRSFPRRVAFSHLSLEMLKWVQVKALGPWRICHIVLRLKNYTVFSEARHPSGQSALKPRLVQWHGGRWPPGTFSHLHTGYCLSAMETVLCDLMSWFLTLIWIVRY